MSRLSLYHKVRGVTAMPSATRATAAAVNGATIDINLGRANFRTVLFAIHTGTVTDGSHAVTIQDSDDGTTWADASADIINGTLPTITATDGDQVFEVGLKPTKRYARVVVTTSGATSGGMFGALAVLGQPSSTPVSRT